MTLTLRRVQGLSRGRITGHQRKRQELKLPIIFIVPLALAALATSCKTTAGVPGGVYLVGVAGGG